jgi:phosphate transport system permease protein
MTEMEKRMSSEALVDRTVADRAPTADSVAEQIKRRPRRGESIIEALLFTAGAISILTTVGIVFVLVRDALDFFASPEVSLVAFLTGTVWQPQLGKFGIWPLLTATLVISFIAMLVAVPIGYFTAVYLSEYASPRFRAWLKPILEILAGIPTVVLGYFALTFVTPQLRAVFGDDVVRIYNMASAGIVVGILIIPLIASLGEDALHAVPDSLRQASYGLGATRMETSLRVVTPAALSGLSAAIVVAASRAVGETMIVALAAGAGPNFTINAFESAETMTGYMVRISGGDLGYGSIDYQSIFAVGLVVFLLTLLLNIVSVRIVRRFREVYE